MVSRFHIPTAVLLTVLLLFPAKALCQPGDGGPETPSHPCCPRRVPAAPPPVPPCCLAMSLPGESAAVTESREEAAAPQVTATLPAAPGLGEPERVAPPAPVTPPRGGTARRYPLLI